MGLWAMSFLFFATTVEIAKSLVFRDLVMAASINFGLFEATTE